MSMLHRIPLLALAGLLALSACKKEDPLPPNPYDNVNYGTPPTPPPPPDPTSITGIHQNIFTVKCNNPGCHDGTFEPDFRTVQSSWTTLVYHKLVKNDAADAYTYRVTPFDTGASMFWRRITRGDAALQQMPATGNLLTAQEQENIRVWIANGARDMFGNLAELPNNEPQIMGYVAYTTTFSRLDTNRVSDIPYYPFYAPPASLMYIAILVEDDSTLTQNLQVNQLRLSTDMDDFSAATTVNASYQNLGGFQVWLALVNTGTWASGTDVYFRYYVNDGDHAQNTEFPRTDMEDGYKTYAAFRVQ